MKTYLFIIFTIIYFVSTAQKTNQINWISFEELTKVQKKQSKPVFVYLYAKWCVYCKKMNQSAFTNTENMQILNDKYHAVKFNIESKKTIFFNNKKFENQELKTNRNPTHQLAKYLTNQQTKNIHLPALMILDNNYNIVKKINSYLTPKDLNTFLNQL